MDGGREKDGQAIIPDGQPLPSHAGDYQPWAAPSVTDLANDTFIYSFMYNIIIHMC